MYSAEILYATTRAGVSHPWGTTDKRMDDPTAASILVIGSDKVNSPWLLVKDGIHSIVHRLKDPSDPVAIDLVYTSDEAVVRLERQRTGERVNLHFYDEGTIYSFLRLSDKGNYDVRCGVGFTSSNLREAWTGFTVPFEWPGPLKLSTNIFKPANKTAQPIVVPGATTGQTSSVVSTNATTSAVPRSPVPESDGAAGVSAVGPSTAPTVITATDSALPSSTVAEGDAPAAAMAVDEVTFISVPAVVDPMFTPFGSPTLSPAHSNTLPATPSSSPVDSDASSGPITPPVRQDVGYNAFGLAMAPAIFRGGALDRHGNYLVRPRCRNGCATVAVSTSEPGSSPVQDEAGRPSKRVRFGEDDGMSSN
ncbi:hypothetical protein BV22DRAFT_1051231 [Leucogyrophana mollusca]|uniref:Uncharacterized protein n=1 Tax=Leucogyrophana mollusca TaxID=85980 RepID=A0ACB8B0I7_9AGAM|nr:hypothetical protein BV22DRAFT_1051231 [Leucogyrophana mollusca]